MSTYIHFTDEQKQRAASVDLEEFLRCRGEKLLTSGREKRLARDHSVTIRGNEWYDHAEERGGHAVSFVQRFYHLSYPEAVTMLLGGEMGTVYPSAQERVEEPPKPFVLPPANSNMRRVYAYLVKHRNIDRSVVAHFAREKLLYEDADYHNAVFVGTDEDGIPRHAHKRSANSFGKAFRLNVEGCDPCYSFHHIGTDRSLYVFEAPIDMLSYITLHPEGWQSHSYVACCGTFGESAYTGALKVLKVILNYEYLWVNLRVKGGAYGCMSSFGRNGETMLVSYRDPKLGETNRVYEGIPEYLRTFSIDDRDMTKYVIGAFSELDAPLNPAAKGARNLGAWLSGVTDEMIQRERDQVLNVTQEDIRALAGLLESVLNTGALCAIGNDQQIVNEQELFNEIKHLYH